MSKEKRFMLVLDVNSATALALTNIKAPRDYFHTHPVWTCMRVDTSGPYLLATFLDRNPTADNQVDTAVAHIPHSAIVFVFETTKGELPFGFETTKI
ncbi:hypothetical protein XFRB_02005 [Xylella fastidiosa]|uniref:hypothetical protein n=1 Tax=Xylella fastidiosa TaxID=2371 RepID=UPI0015698A14|nr:hypothetical protein [Xylella fastidiosa]NRP54185.1 hypothetical protein [Xylella fastidiosa]